MAARPDQNLQIGLIISAVLIVLLAAATYMGWKSYADANAQIAAQKTEMDGLRTSAGNWQQEATSLKQMVGLGENDSLDVVTKQYEEDQKKYMANYDEPTRKYRVIVDKMWTDNAGLATQLSDSKGREQELRVRLSAVEAEKEAQIKQFQQKLTQLEQDAATERNKFSTDREDLEAKQRELLAALDKNKAEFDKQIADATSKSQAAQDQLADSERARDNLLNERKQESPSFETADGAVTYVDQRNGVVWLDLGSEDSLRRQITFSVFESDQTDAGKTVKKGSLEVTRILGDHEAEARITNDDPRNPILPGDKIYSQVWQRGKALRFALTGVIDIDGDGRQDLQQAKDLISLNGGVIDSIVTDEGGVEGEIDVKTRYLVLGEFPEDPNQGKLRESFQNMSTLAKTNGVETITLDEFLSQMGYRPEDRTVVLGSGARSRDFKATDDKAKFRPRSAYYRF